MPRPSRPALRARSRVLLATAATAALATALLPTTPASSADEAPACPAAYPVGALAKGDPVHGLTVSEGSTPDEFTGEVVGVIDDGIALGLDMVMVKLSGSVITDAAGAVDRGIWSGMSGSPVYAEDGRLIGAVSYGLSMSPSEYAGVTPAAAMYDLGRYEGRSLGGAASVATTPRAVTALRTTGLPAARAQHGFSRLPTPTGVSGIARERFDLVSQRLGLRGSSLAAGGTADADEPAGAIVPGGNVAMALSYGDLTAAGVGTVTAVCGDAVLAFGHPFALTGHATASLHGAEAVFVQRDTTFGSYKVANPTAPVGVFTQDRLAGILGRLGTPPAGAPVTSTVRTTGGDRRTGRTRVVNPGVAAQVAAMHLVANLDGVYDGYQGGTGRLRWSLTVRRADGRLARLTHSDVYSSGRDLTAEMPWDFYLNAASVLDNPFEEVDLVGVHQHARLRTGFRQHRLGVVQVRRHGRWMVPGARSVVPLRAGGTLRMRVRLVPALHSESVRRRAYVSLRVPRSARGVGRVLLSGGQSRFESPGRGATSLPDLLARLAAAPANSTVTAELRVRARGGVRRVQRHVEKPAPVVGTRYVTVAVR